ncbi:XdhC family protein [Clostridium thailandense]|uniref:XdhC family protein n=1 Tax=Clostridium thailandense TaxID=2794346 RepID=UPI0039899F0D
MEEKILKEVYESLRRGERVALATITDSSGSAPRKSGSTMAVWKDGRILGSVGGGIVEHKVILKTIECIKKLESANFEYVLSEKGGLDAQCGGEIKGFIKVFNPSPKLLIAGAGHIGQQLHKLGKILGFYTVIFDDREELVNSTVFDDADEIVIGNIGDTLAKYEVTEDTYITIVTKGHRSDSDALMASVSRKAAYVGMIGSTKKILFIMQNLINAGVPKEDLQKVYSPMGLNIASEKPEEIALGILSEILLIRNKGSLDHMKNLKKINI